MIREQNLFGDVELINNIILYNNNNNNKSLNDKSRLNYKYLPQFFVLFNLLNSIILLLILFYYMK